MIPRLLGARVSCALASEVLTQEACSRPSREVPVSTPGLCLENSDLDHLSVLGRHPAVAHRTVLHALTWDSGSCWVWGYTCIPALVRLRQGDFQD